MALSGKYVAVSTMGHTIVFHHDGTVVKRATLPRWHEGVVTRDTLVIVERDSRLAVLDIKSLQLLWSE